MRLMTDLVRPIDRTRGRSRTNGANGRPTVANQSCHLKALNRCARMQGAHGMDIASAQIAPCSDSANTREHSPNCAMTADGGCRGLMATMPACCATSSQGKLSHVW